MSLIVAVVVVVVVGILGEGDLRPIRSHNFCPSSRVAKCVVKRAVRRSQESFVCDFERKPSPSLVPGLALLADEMFVCISLQPGKNLDLDVVVVVDRWAATAATRHDITYRGLIHPVR